jgi:hypothetical protein
MLSFQVLVWLDLLFVSKNLQKSGPSWIPRLGWAFLVSCILIFALEIVSEILLVLQENPFVVLQVYRAFLSIYLLILLVITIVFGIRFFCVVNNSQTDTVSARAKRSKRNLTRLVIFSSFILLGGLIIAVVSSEGSVIVFLFGLFFPLLQFLSTQLLLGATLRYLLSRVCWTVLLCF